jgi:CheY-like chemotaxis protein
MTPIVSRRGFAAATLQRSLPARRIAPVAARWIGPARDRRDSLRCYSHPQRDRRSHHACAREHALEHHDIHVVCSDRQGLARHLKRNKLDLIILDLRQARRDEFGLLRRVLFASIPVITIGDPQCQATDRVAALELGADDCMSEPIAPRELVARARAILRRRGRTRVAAVRDRGGGIGLPVRR